MKIIKLKSLRLNNFKGIKDLAVNFEDVTSIFGRNEAGKTTLMDAFLFNLFGKDSTDRKDFEIKTLDTNGKAKEKLDHEVTATLEVDGREIVTRRIYREKWNTKRGEKKETFTGHETELFWNGTPVTLNEYQAKVNNLIPESVFKLITNPLYFNSIKWQDRRNVLMEVAGEISITDIVDSIAGKRADFADLLSSLNKGILDGLSADKALEEYRRKVAAQRKRIKDTLETYPTRIDEATRSMPAEQDFEFLSRQILAKEKEIAELDAALQDVANAQKERNNGNLARQNEIYAHQQQIQTHESAIRSQFNTDKSDRETKIKAARAEGRSKDSELNTQKTYLTTLQRKQDTLKSAMQQLRDEWTKVNAQQPHKHEDDFTCPSCHQQLPAGTIEEKKTAQLTALQTFNDNKVKRLGEITTDGTAKKLEFDRTGIQIAETEKVIAGLNAEIETLRSGISTMEDQSVRLNQDADQTIADQIAANADIKDLKLRIADLDAAIEASRNNRDDNSEINTRRKLLVVDLDALKKSFNTKEQIAQQEKRIKELKTEESDLADQLVQQDGLEYSINQFIRAKMEAITERINSRFKYARFKLFEDQINGGQTECCETTYKGVPFTDLNTAGKILVGIDVINALSDFYQASAPIWLDNRESVSSIPTTEAQVINLIVSGVDKVLRIEGSRVREIAMA